LRKKKDDEKIETQATNQIRPIKRETNAKIQMDVNVKKDEVEERDEAQQYVRHEKEKRKKQAKDMERKSRIAWITMNKTEQKIKMETLTILELHHQIHKCMDHKEYANMMKKKYEIRNT